MNMLFVFLLAIVSEMQTGVMVTGHILDDRTGGPLAAVPVFLGGRPTGGNEVFRREAISDAAGVFSFRDVPPGTYSLEACCRNSHVKSVNRSIVVGNQALLNVDLATRKYIEVHGQVTVEGRVNAPAEWYGAQVLARSVGGGTFRSSTSIRPSGSFVLYLPEGEYQIEINNPDSYSVKSIMFESNDLVKNALKLEGPVSSNIEITLAPR